MSDMGSLFHCRRPLRTGHASARDCSKPHCEIRIKPSVPENSEATRSAGKVQLSDGLASAHEHRCGTYMVAPCNSRIWKGPLFLAPKSIGAATTAADDADATTLFYATPNWIHQRPCHSTGRLHGHAEQLSMHGFDFQIRALRATRRPHP